MEFLVTLSITYRVRASSLNKIKKEALAEAFFNELNLKGIKVMDIEAAELKDAIIIEKEIKALQSGLE